MNIITGVGNANQIQEWEDFIDLDFEIALTEKIKELISIAEENDKPYEQEDIACEAVEQLEGFSGETQLYGSWLQDGEDKYYPDPDGEYAMIYDSNNNIYQVIHSQYAIQCYHCSPCYPNQGDIDSEGDLLAYCLPPDMMNEEWIEENKDRIIKL